MAFVTLKTIIMAATFMFVTIIAISTNQIVQYIYQ